MAEGEFHECVAPMNTQFLTNIIPVSFDGAGTDEKFLSNLLTGLVFGDR